MPSLKLTLPSRIVPKYADVLFGPVVPLLLRVVKTYWGSGTIKEIREWCASGSNLFPGKYVALPLDISKSGETAAYKTEKNKYFSSTGKKIKIRYAQKNKGPETMVKNFLTCYFKKDYVFICC